MQDSSVAPNNAEQVPAPEPSPTSPSTPTMTIDSPKKKNSPTTAIIAVVAAIVIAVICLAAFMPAENKDNTNNKPADNTGGNTAKTENLEPIAFKYSKTSITLYGTFGETVKNLSSKYHIIHYVSDGGIEGHEEDIKNIDSYLRQSPNDSYEKLYLGYSENRSSLGLEIYPAYDKNAETLAELPCNLWVNVNLWADNNPVYFDEIGPFKKNMTADDIENLPIKFTKKESEEENESIYTAEYKKRQFTVTIYDYDDFFGTDSETLIRINYKQQ